MMRLHLTTLLAAALIGGCTTLPVETPSSTLPASAAEDQWQTVQAVDTQGPADTDALAWWELFDDPTLSELITRGLSANQDVLIASARLRQGAAAVRAARAGRRPQLDFAVNARRAEVSSQGAGAASQLNGAGLINAVNEFYDLGANLAWEADVFGRLGAQITAAQSNLAANAADQRAVELTVAASIASTYLELRALQAQLAVERTNVRISEEQFTLARDLAAGGLAPELDALRAEGQLEQSQARLPGIEAQIAGQRFALATLIGEVPQALAEALAVAPPLPPSPPDVLPTGVRSALLHRRPDVTAAGWRVEAAAATLEATAKVRLPQLVLTGAGGTDAGTFAQMLEASSVTWLLGAAISLPLYRGGAIRADVDDAEAQLAIARLQWDRTALVALQEAETALATFAAARAERDRLQLATAATAQAADIATRLYDTGLGDYLAVLDARREDRTATLALVQARNRMNQRAVDLYRALGGGWSSVSAPATVDVLASSR